MKAARFPIHRDLAGFDFTLSKVDESLIGGYVLEMEGKLIDTSILRDLNDVKKQFANNDYIHKLR